MFLFAGELRRQLKERTHLNDLVNEITMNDAWDSRAQKLNIKKTSPKGCCTISPSNNSTKTKSLNNGCQFSGYFKFQEMRWKHLHEAFDFISDLTQEYEELHQMHPTQFLASKEKINRFGVVTMLLLRQEYRLFIFYLVLYLAERQDLLGEDNLSEKFISTSEFLTLLEAVTLNDLIHYAPLFVKYLKHHPEQAQHFYHTKDESVDLDTALERDMNEMFKVLHQRDFFLRIRVASFNTFTAGLICDIAFHECTYLNYFKKSLKQRLTDSQLASFIYKVGGLTVSKNSAYFHDVLAQRLLHTLKPSDESPSEEPHRPKISKMQSYQPDSVQFWAEESGHDLPLMDSLRDERREMVFKKLKGEFAESQGGTKFRSSRIGTHLPPSIKDFFLSHAETNAATYRATLCFLLQIFLYIAILHIHSPECDFVNYFDYLKPFYRYATAILILVFTFTYGLQTTMAEFATGSFAMILHVKTARQRLLLVMQIISNAILPLFVVYFTALVLKIITELPDLILNSIAVFFILDLDAMLVSDDSKIDDCLLYTYLGIMHSAGTQPKFLRKPQFRKKMTILINAEKAFLWLFVLFGLCCLVFSFVYVVYLPQAKMHGWLSLDQRPGGTVSCDYDDSDSDTYAATSSPKF